MIGGLTRIRAARESAAVGTIAESLPSVIVLVRHAEAEPPGRRPQSERPLTDIGVRQAGQVAARLATELADTPTTVITSPYDRCRQTAEPIAASLASELVVDERLRERGPGIADRLSFGESLSQFPEIATTPWGWDAVTDSEPWQRVFDRGADLLATLGPETVPVLVTHGGNIHLLTSAWLGLEHLTFVALAFDVYLASISVLFTSVFDGGAVSRLSDTSHLVESGPPPIGHQHRTNQVSRRAFAQLATTAVHPRPPRER